MIHIFLSKMTVQLSPISVIFHDNKNPLALHTFIMCKNILYNILDVVQKLYEEMAGQAMIMCNPEGWTDRQTDG